MAQAIFAQKSGLILQILGGPGAGKTSLFHAIGDVLGIPVERRRKVNFSGAAPSEVSGFAVPQVGGGRLKWDAPDWLPLASEVGDAPFLLLADEFSDWDGAVQSLFRGIYDPDGQPHIGPHKLPAGLFVVLTGNRGAVDGSRNSRTISAPIVRRSLTLELVPDRDAVLTHFAAAGLGATAAWQFLNFASAEQAAAFFAPPVPAPWDGAPFPTPAGWEAASRMEAIGDGTELHTAWTGTLGDAAGQALWAFRQAIHRWAPSVAAIRSGAEIMNDSDPLKASAVTAAAVRIAVRETKADPRAAVAAGAVDWLVDLVLSRAGRERGEAGFKAALASGLPLDTHPRAGFFTPAPF